MTMHPFSLIRPSNLDEARAAALENPAGRPLRAGGVDLIDRMKEGLERPEALIELRAATGGEHAAGMRGLQQGEAGRWELGALLTLEELGGFDAFPTGLGLIREAAREAATPSIRSMATLGGNLLQRPRCWYYRNSDLSCLKKGGKYCLAIAGEHRYHSILGGGPSWIVHPSTLAAALVAADASVEILGADGSLRELQIGELFVGPKEDATREHRLAPGEILTRVLLPASGPGQRSAYEAAREKQSHDWPLAEAAVALTVESGAIKTARVALGHVAPVPWRAAEAEAALIGKAPSADVIAAAARASTAGAKPLKHNAYKIPLAQGLVRLALHRACGVPLPE